MCNFQDEWYSQCIPKAASLAGVPGMQHKEARAHRFLGNDHVMFQRLMQSMIKRRASATDQELEHSSWTEGVDAHMSVGTVGVGTSEHEEF
jgi:hypothetical protein